MSKIAYLVLEDGSVYEGVAFGAESWAYGEVVFNTSMTGYQETLTDPSYAGQIVMPTYPLIGNYGVNPEDVESRAVQVAGFVVRHHSPHPSHAKSTATIHDYLASHGVPGLSEVDTRAITRKLRLKGVMMGMITNAEPEMALKHLQDLPRYGTVDFVQQVTAPQAYQWEQPSVQETAPLWRIVVTDCGLKYNILRLLRLKGCQVTAVPAGASVIDILALQPHGVVFSPGPGDPALLDYAVEMVKGVVGRVPVMGICLGHQLLARAFGARTFKLKFGHRGETIQSKTWPLARCTSLPKTTVMPWMTKPCPLKWR